MTGPYVWHLIREVGRCPKKTYKGCTGRSCSGYDKFKPPNDWQANSPNPEACVPELPLS